MADPLASARQPVLDASSIARALRRIADEIIERNGATGLHRLALVGIQYRGVEIARRLVDAIESIEGVRPAYGELDVSMHRDDLSRRERLTSIRPTRLPPDLDKRTVVLVDDVFYTGRTARAAMDALGDYGRPPVIQLAALVDRGGRELPVRPDYVGRETPSAADERVQVRFENLDGEPDAVWLIRPSQP